MWFSFSFLELALSQSCFNHIFQTSFLGSQIGWSSFPYGSSVGRELQEVARMGWPGLPWENKLLLLRLSLIFDKDEEPGNVLALLSLRNVWSAVNPKGSILALSVWQKSLLWYSEQLYQKWERPVSRGQGLSFREWWLSHGKWVAKRKDKDRGLYALMDLE